MGWKASIIVINAKNELGNEALLNALGCYSINEVTDQPFEAIMNPDEQLAYIGEFNNSTVICVQDLPLSLLEADASKAELTLSKLFPNTEIAALVLQSVVNLWGYSISKDGQKIRVRAGSSERGTIVDCGEIVEEEKELFSQAKITESGNRVFIFDGLPEEKFEDDQVGENFVFNISSRYFGEDLDMADDLLETSFKGYRFSNKKPAPPKAVESAAIPSKAVEIPKPPKKKKKWWEFWK